MLGRALLGTMAAAVVASTAGPDGREPPASGPDGWPADTAVIASTAAERQSVAVTVYNQNFGLVREVRRLRLPGGLTALEFGDVAANLQPETVHIRRIDGRHLQVMEQNYRFDLLSPEKLLEKYVGRTVTVYRRDPSSGADIGVPARVLSVNGGTVLEIDGEITFNYPGRFAFPEVPNNLIPEPTLVWLLDTEEAPQDVEVSYLTQNLSWKSDYVLVLEDDERSAGMTAWVTLSNRSGTSYNGAELKLVAGDVQRVTDRRRDMVMLERAAAAVDEAQFVEEGFFEYHLYTLGRPTDLLDNEQKQVTLLEAEGVRTRKRLVFAGSPYYYRSNYGQVAANQKVSTFIEMENTSAAGLGMALPAGIIRVYKRDSSGAQQFVGEDRIDHTPDGEAVTIKLGEAFDVVGDRTQMEYEVVSGCVSESSWVIELRNHKDEEVSVDVVEPIGGDWEIRSSSHRWERIDAVTFRFRVDVDSKGSERIEYRVRVRWC